MNDLLDFYKIKDGYLNYLKNGIGMAKHQEDENIINPLPYVGPVFYKKSAHGLTLKFYVPVYAPASDDFTHDINIDNSYSKSEEIAHRTDYDYKDYRLAITSLDWTKENDYNIIMFMQLSDMIPVPDNQLQRFDIWNDSPLLKETTQQRTEQNHKGEFARFKQLEKVFSSIENCNMIKDACIEFYADKLSYETGRYNPYDWFPKEYAKEIEKSFTTGNKALELETESVVFMLPEYQSKLKILSEKDSVLGSLAKKNLATSENKIAKEISALLIEEQHKPISEQKAPNFYVAI